MRLPVPNADNTANRLPFAFALAALVLLLGACGAGSLPTEGFDPFEGGESSTDGRPADGGDSDRDPSSVPEAGEALAVDNKPETVPVGEGGSDEPSSGSGNGTGEPMPDGVGGEQTMTDPDFEGAPDGGPTIGGTPAGGTPIDGTPTGGADADGGDDSEGAGNENGGNDGAGNVGAEDDRDGHGNGEEGTSEESGGQGGNDQDGDADAEIAVTGPVRCDAPAAHIRQRALELINAARAEARECGDGQRFAAVDALGWDSRLEDAARTHSADMAGTGNFDHTGTDGSSPGERITRASYTWRTYGENIAAGQGSLEEAVAGWIESPGHCRNVMKSDVSDTAVACVANAEAYYGRYWTHVVAHPRP